MKILAYITGIIIGVTVASLILPLVFTVVHSGLLEIIYLLLYIAENF